MYERQIHTDSLTGLICRICAVLHFWPALSMILTGAAILDVNTENTCVREGQTGFEF